MRVLRAGPAAGAGVPSPAEALLQASRAFHLGGPGLEGLARAASAATEADWLMVIEEARRSGGGGLLFQHLCAAGVEPPAALRREHRRIAASNVARETELQRVGGALERESLSVMLIKGAALQRVVYENIGVRPMSDADWVLPEGEGRGRVLRVLEEMGYQPWDQAYQSIWSRGDFLIDLHLNPLGDERVEARISEAGKAAAGAEIWSRVRSSHLGKGYVIPAPEDHLLILCTHLMKHNLEPGYWFTDLEALLRAEPELDWEAVLSRARAWGLLRPLAYSFRSLGALGGGKLGAPALALPAGAREALREVRPGPLDRLLLALAGRSTRLRGEKEEWGRPPVANLLWLSSRKGLGAKLCLLWEAAFPRHEVMTQIYPGYRPALRGWFLLRRAADLLRLALRLAARAGR